MPTVLITGANRGIGLGFAKHYAKEGWQVLGCCRSPGEAAALKKLPGTRVLALDVADETSIDRLAKEISGTPIDLLINNAGHGGPVGVDFGATRQADWLPTLLTNTVGPYMLIERLAANVLASQQKKFVSITSGLGSIGEATSDYAPIYSISKAALNMGAKRISAILGPRGAIVIVMSPGWVKTAMGGQSAPLSVEKSVAGMTAVIAGLTKDDNGSFYNHDGKILPW
ncbi:MAG TPA: SDR family oxidoreductase [Kiloniellales bacterium]|nr:SDR family oxidoreductase [Kiloniellales bacterium]